MTRQAAHPLPQALRQRYGEWARRQAATPRERMTRWLMQWLSHRGVPELRQLWLVCLALIETWSELTTRVTVLFTAISAVTFTCVAGWLISRIQAGDPCVAVIGGQGWPPCALLGLALLPLLASGLWMAITAPVAVRLTCRAYRELRRLVLQAGALLLVRVRRWLMRLQQQLRLAQLLELKLLTALPPPNDIRPRFNPRVLCPGVQTLAP